MQLVFNGREMAVPMRHAGVIQHFAVFRHDLNLSRMQWQSIHPLHQVVDGSSVRMCWKKRGTRHPDHENDNPRRLRKGGPAAHLPRGLGNPGHPPGWRGEILKTLRSLPPICWATGGNGIIHVAGQAGTQGIANRTNTSRHSRRTHRAGI